MSRLSTTITGAIVAVAAVLVAWLLWPAGAPAPPTPASPVERIDDAEETRPAVAPETPAARAERGAGEPVPGEMADDSPDPPTSAQWAADIARFSEMDAANPPPAQPVVFTGSSSIRMWESLHADFPGARVLNRGFGGSQIRDLTRHAGDVAIRYRPRQIVVYSGDNDIDAGRSPQQVAADFRAFVTRIRRDLPDVPIAWISIKPSLARATQLDAQREANALLREAATGMREVDFVDVHTPMLDARGQPRPELFADDGLHMNPEGYALWRRIIAPYLE